jgi:hypothetical protein
MDTKITVVKQISSPEVGEPRRFSNPSSLINQRTLVSRPRWSSPRESSTQSFSSHQLTNGIEYTAAHVRDITKEVNNSSHATGAYSSIGATQASLTQIHTLLGVNRVILSTQQSGESSISKYNKGLDTPSKNLGKPVSSKHATNGGLDLKVYKLSQRTERIPTGAVLDECAKRSCHRLRQSREKRFERGNGVRTEGSPRRDPEAHCEG